MSFWVREVVGWLFIVLGLAVFFLCVMILLSPGPRLFEAGPLALIGIFLFRGGLHLLKVAIAARVAMRLQQRTQRPEPKAIYPLPPTLLPQRKP